MNRIVLVQSFSSVGTKNDELRSYPKAHFDNSSIDFFTQAHALKPSTTATAIVLFGLMHSVMIRFLFRHGGGVSRGTLLERLLFHMYESRKYDLQKKGVAGPGEVGCGSVPNETKDGNS